LHGARQKWSFAGNERGHHTTCLPGEQVAGEYLDWMLGRGEVEGAVMVAESTNVLVGFVAGWIEETENVDKTLDSNRVKYISDICVMPDLRGHGLPHDTLWQLSSLFWPSESRCAWWAPRRLRRVVHGQRRRVIAFRTDLKLRDLVSTTSPVPLP
jgi:hypothetical protein